MEDGLTNKRDHASLKTQEVVQCGWGRCMKAGRDKMIRLGRLTDSRSWNVPCLVINEGARKCK